MERIVDLIRSKRNGGEIPLAEFERLVKGFTLGEISEAQMGAFLMAGVCSGFTEIEAASITTAMLGCGERLDLGDLGKPRVDCYSTGGVGDKTPLIAAPIAAAAGVAVPMVVSHGTGPVIGNLSKLQAIPNLRTDLDIAEFTDQVSRNGLAFAEQSNSLAPAEKRFFELREQTATVDNVALIAASAMSKKLTEDIEGLIVDIKVSRGSLLSSRTEARRLAQQMISIGRKLRVKVQALLTDMEQPLGYTVGNALEIMEVSQTLRGEGPEDVQGLANELAARMIFLADTSMSIESARETAQQAVADGSALRALLKTVESQGGDPESLVDNNKLPCPSGATGISSPRDGFVSKIDAHEIGRAAILLGAGRGQDEASADPAVGVVLETKVGQQVVNGTGLCSLYYNDETNLPEAQELVENAFRISTFEPPEHDLVLDLL